MPTPRARGDLGSVDDYFRLKSGTCAASSTYFSSISIIGAHHHQGFDIARVEAIALVALSVSNKVHLLSTSAFLVMIWPKNAVSTSLTYFVFQDSKRKYQRLTFKEVEEYSALGSTNAT